MEHDENNDKCWCDPEVLQICSELGDQENCLKDCWKCKGRSLIDAYDETLDSVIVHREEESR